MAYFWPSLPLRSCIVPNTSQCAGKGADIVAGPAGPAGSAIGPAGTKRLDTSRTVRSWKCSGVDWKPLHLFWSATVDEGSAAAAWPIPRPAMASDQHNLAKTDAPAIRTPGLGAHRIRAAR